MFVFVGRSYWIRCTSTSRVSTSFAVAIPLKRPFEVWMMSTRVDSALSFSTKPLSRPSPPIRTNSCVYEMTWKPILVDGVYSLWCNYMLVVFCLLFLFHYCVYNLCFCSSLYASCATVAVLVASVRKSVPTLYNVASFVKGCAVSALFAVTMAYLRCADYKAEDRQ